jgi:hypothetical protein
MMTNPESNEPEQDQTPENENDVPAANPAYSTPPADGLPDAETD